MIVKCNEKILTIKDVPKEEDAFDYSPNYPSWIEAIFTTPKEKPNARR